MKFREFIAILESEGFELHRSARGSAKIWKGMVNGQVQTVSMHYSQGGEEIKPGTLRGMIRHSGLPKKLFRR